MSDNLPAITGGLLPSRIDRQVSKALERIEAGAMIAKRSDLARMDRAAGTAEHGMVRAAQLGALEATLIQNIPSAAGYVHASTVAGAINIAGIVHQAGRGA